MVEIFFLFFFLPETSGCTEYYQLTWQKYLWYKPNQALSESGDVEKDRGAIFTTNTPT